ncbi:unnamed protein product [Lactuca virosa]|uniref:Mitochondrial protein n=1 Tax=Lactuca virosa TaxID=75947 RepID=A0AAU9PM13_9ASTR|nr:unnamed protein product [Lactuca virosa]
MVNAKPVITPIKSATSLIDNSAPSDETRYRQIMGALQYLTITRPNIDFATNRLSQSMHDPNDTQLSAGYAIYLGSNIISWKSSRQKSISRSSIEDEYKAIAMPHQKSPGSPISSLNLV